MNRKEVDVVIKFTVVFYAIFGRFPLEIEISTALSMIALVSK